MAGELREGHQVVPHFLRVCCPNTHLSKARGTHVEQQVLGLDEGVGLVGIGFKQVRHHHQQYFHYAV